MYLVLYVLSWLTCLVPYVFLWPPYIASYVLSCPTCSSALLAPVLHVFNVLLYLTCLVPCVFSWYFLPRASRSLLLLIPYLLQVLQAYLNFLQPMVKLFIVIRHFLRNNVFAMVWRISHISLLDLLTSLNKPILCYWSLFKAPENIKKDLVFKE